RVDAGQRRALVAARAARARVRPGRLRPEESEGLGRRLRRRTLDGDRGDQPRRADDRPRALTLRALHQPPGRLLRDEGRRGAAEPVRRPRGEDGVSEAMATVVPPVTNPLRHGLRLARTPEPATLVLFGGSGDLAGR